MFERNSCRISYIPYTFMYTGARRLRISVVRARSAAACLLARTRRFRFCRFTARCRGQIDDCSKGGEGGDSVDVRISVSLSPVPLIDTRFEGDDDEIRLNNAFVSVITYLYIIIYVHNIYQSSRTCLPAR